MDREFDRTIDCESFEDRVQDLMDRRIALDSDPLLREHSATCANCQKAYSSFQSLESVLSAAFVDECLADTDFESARPDLASSAAHWGIAAAIISLAAMLLVAIVPMFNQSSDGLMVADKDNSLSTSVVDAPDRAPSEQPKVLNEERAEMINLVSYDTIPPSLRNAYQYAAELPGIRPIECSVTVTIEALQKSWNPPSKPKQDKENPDLGQSNTGHENGLA